MRYHVLASGSKGNATIIKSTHGILMIDNGLSSKKLLAQKLAEIDVSLQDINALLITHGHEDHIKMVATIPYEKRYGTQEVARDIESYTKEEIGILKNHYLSPYETKTIAGFQVTILPTSHDAFGSVGFFIKDQEETLAYITDTGFIYENTLKIINNCDYYILESNHDVPMLLETSRPQLLKDRILGDKGHLSNEDCALYLSEIIGPKTKEIIFAHISEEANNPEQVLATFLKIMEKRGISLEHVNYRCASQRETISGGNVVFEDMYA